LAPPRVVKTAKNAAVEQPAEARKPLSPDGRISGARLKEGRLEGVVEKQGKYRHERKIGPDSNIDLELNDQSHRDQVEQVDGVTWHSLSTTFRGIPHSETLESLVV
jgi:hypothetical protein